MEQPYSVPYKTSLFSHVLRVLCLTDCAPMASAKTCLRSGGNVLLRDAFLCQKPPRHHHSCPNRPYSSANESAKPRPYSVPPKSKKLVGTRSQTLPTNSSSTPNVKAPPNVNSKANDVFAPYWRISIGVLFCGSLIYSMVPLPLSSPIPKLTYMHASSPPPSNSKLPPSQTETTSPSANPE